ncbi:MAG: DUF2950 domain-containing protein [Desulfobulbaceae bacterium]|nr:DUF2950 domain-containing protein [Desulfobulbaceae bacterium]
MNKSINLYKYAMIILLAINAGLVSCHANNESNKQSVFASPELAVEALKTALKDNNIPELLNIFGHQYKSRIDTADKAAEQVRRNKFYQVISDGYKLESKEPDKVTVLIGKNDWPFSIPLVKNDAGWYFDTNVGIDEILNRRIGHNELAAIAACDAILDAQVEYASIDHDNDGVLEFSQKFKSTPGQQDGLYWVSPKDAASSDKSPLEAFVIDAGDYIQARTSTKDPYKGYFFKVISSQGKNAVGGKYNYLVNNNMIAGFAVIAWPAEYANTGIMTFMMSHEGTILEKDLGENTTELVANMSAINPDKSWQPVQLGGK